MPHTLAVHFYPSSVASGQVANTPMGPFHTMVLDFLMASRSQRESPALHRSSGRVSQKRDLVPSLPKKTREKTPSKPYGTSPNPQIHLWLTCPSGLPSKCLWVSPYSAQWVPFELVGHRPKVFQLGEPGETGGLVVHLDGLGADVQAQEAVRHAAAHVTSTRLTAWLLGREEVEALGRAAAGRYLLGVRNGMSPYIIPQKKTSPTVVF